MYACMVCVYTCVHASMCICMYVYMYACVHTCMYVCMQFSSWILSGTEGIVLVGRGNCPGGNCPGGIVRGELSGGKCPFPRNRSHGQGTIPYCVKLTVWHL